MSVGGPNALFLSRHPEARPTSMVSSLMVRFLIFPLGLRESSFSDFLSTRHGDAPHSPREVRGRTVGP
ncbi:hypothetical protein KKD84_03615 [Patescibacteria group bacterium]|nr:hypothetical protein [Patescibacteria group bacterium]